MDVSENARLLWKKICLQSRYKFKSLQLLTILESDLLQIIVSLNLSLEGESDSKKTKFSPRNSICQSRAADAAPVARTAGGPRFPI
jgi:hypothetical protein